MQSQRVREPTKILWSILNRLKTLSPSDLLFSAFVPLAAWKLLYRLESVHDLSPSDESLYLTWGLAFPSNGMADPSWSPLYVMWYALLSQFREDPISLYYLSSKIVLRVSVVVFFVCLRLRRVPSLLSASVAVLLFIVSSEYGPLTNHFGLIILCTTVIVVHFTKRRSIRLSILALGTLLFSYARPEGAVVFIFVIAYFVWKCRERRMWKAAATTLILSGAIVQLMGFPMSGTLTGRNRAHDIFCDGFYRYYVASRSLPFESETKCSEAIADSFGFEAHSISDALFADPVEFSAYIGFNLTRMVDKVGEFVVNRPILIFPQGKGWIIFENSLFALFLLVFLYTSWKRLNFSSLFEDREMFILLLGVLICFLAIGATTNLTARSFLVPVAIALMALLPLLPKHRPPPFLPALLLSTLMLGIVPNLKEYHSGQTNDRLYNVAAVRKVLRISKRAPGITVDLYSHWGGYASKSRKVIRTYPSGLDFIEYLRLTPVGLLIVGNTPAYLSKDIGFGKFRKNPSLYGFGSEVVGPPWAPISLYYRTTTIKESNT